MKKISLSILFCFVFLFLVTGFLGIYLGFIKSARIVFGFAYIMFLPGLLIGFLLLPSPPKSEWWERVVLAVPFSLALVTLITTYVHLAGVALNAVSIFVITSIIIVVELIFLVLFQGRKKQE